MKPNFLNLIRCSIPFFKINRLLQDRNLLQFDKIDSFNLRKRIDVLCWRLWFAFDYYDLGQELRFLRFAASSTHFDEEEPVIRKLKQSNLLKMADEEEPQETELSDNQKIDIAKWFLLNSPPGEIQYMAKDLRLVLKDENVYGRAASEAFPLYNKTHIISLQFPNRSGDILVSSFSEISEDEYLDPRTAQVGKVDHVKQICTEIRPARDEELPTPYIEDYRCALDAEVSKYVAEAYPKGVCSVYCTSGKDVEEPGFDFELVVNGSWRSIWNIEFMDELQTVEVRGKLQVGAHYFEEGNVQLDAQHECKDSTMFQSSDDSAFSLANIIRHHETEYMSSLEVTSYSNLPDSTFKDLRRKLPVTRTLFPWHNTMQFSLTRDITKELGIEK
ncbi:hypothetical protein OSB04_028166 [Centaurea solstitialis]|uniref:F-actin-capping protein subunit alpha n=1 Tax=Centaurea solstitialis TaxID=347529 RepID=A0AA38SSN4_9ASTR|nr:hypothetical protein OSB04_028166 [Centaurea solstitialis]